MKIRPHTHVCEKCQTKFSCDGDLEENYDGWPEVVCAIFHVWGQTDCEDCRERLRQIDP